MTDKDVQESLLVSGPDRPVGTEPPLVPSAAPVPPTAAPAPVATSTPAVRARLGNVSVRLLFERYLLVGVWLALILLFAVTRSNSFLRMATFHNIFSSWDVYVFLGLGALCTNVVGEIDLSIAFIAGLAATLVPLLVSEHGVNVWIAALVALVVSMLCGALNGLLIVVLRIDALIATLGMGTVLLGVAEGLSHEVPVAGVPQSFAKIATTDFLSLPLAFWYGVGLAILLAYVLAYTPLGRHVTFIGSNREVARLAGVRVQRLRFAFYTLGGLLSGLGGVFLAAELGGFDASSSNNYLLPTFAVAFLSAAVVRPGRFNPIGVLIAAYFISTGTLGIQLFGYSGWTEQVFYGGALVAAVSIITLVRRHTARMS